MFEVVRDYDGNIMFVPMPRNSPPRPRRPYGGSPRPRRPTVVHQPPPAYPPAYPQGYPPMHYPMPAPTAGYPMQPVPHAPHPGGAMSLDMRTGMKALGALLPGLGQLLSAFRRAPDKPDLSGVPDKDLPRIVEYIADTFDHDRSGSQMTGVLATTGAVMQILGDL